MKLIKDLEQVRRDCRTNSEKFAVDRAIRVVKACAKPELNEAQELEQSIESIQAALSGSFRDNLKVEITQDHAWLTYGDLKFLVEPLEAWQAVQSCVYLSGLEVDNEA